MTVGFITLMKPLHPIIVNSIESVILFIRSVALKFTYPKYFHNDPKDYKAVAFSEVLKNCNVKVVPSSDRWSILTQYNDEERPTAVILLTLFDRKKPSIIFHHGAGSTSPVRDFNLIFGHECKAKYNVFIVWAQYHASKKEYLQRSVDSFSHHQQTFAGSVLAYEEIVKYHRLRSKLPIVATGSSMGGIVSSLHAFHFGTADYYFPIVAYPNVGEIFLGNAYKTVVDPWQNKQTNQTYFDSFKIESVNPSLIKKLTPIIGMNDKIVPSDKAVGFWEGNGFQVKKYPYGHFTPAIVSREIRRMVDK